MSLPHFCFWNNREVNKEKHGGGCDLLVCKKKKQDAIDESEQQWVDELADADDIVQSCAQELAELTLYRDSLQLELRDLKVLLYSVHLLSKNKKTIPFL